MLRSYLERINYAGGGTLVLAKGTYKVPCVLYLCSNIKIVLRDGAIIKKTSKTGCESRPPHNPVSNGIAYGKQGAQN